MLQKGDRYSNDKALSLEKKISATTSGYTMLVIQYQSATTYCLIVKRVVTLVSVCCERLMGSWDDRLSVKRGRTTRTVIMFMPPIS